MELLDFHSLFNRLYVFELAPLDQPANCKEDEKDAEVNRQCYVVVCLAVSASVPCIDLYTLAFAVELLLDIATGVGAIGVLVAYRNFWFSFLSQTRCTKLRSDENR